jgi:hypothetical protein
VRAVARHIVVDLCVDEPRRFIVVDLADLGGSEVLRSLYRVVALLADTRTGHPAVGSRNGDLWDRLGNCGIGKGVTRRFRSVDVSAGRRCTCQCVRVLARSRRRRRRIRQLGH